MRKWLALVALLLLVTRPGWAAPVDAYPPDPPGARVMDRATENLDESELRVAYAVLYKLADMWYVDIYRGARSQKGVEWKKVYRWRLIFQGQNYEPVPVTVLGIARDTDRLQFYLSEVFRYHEGRVHIYVDWNLKTGKFREGFSD